MELVAQCGDILKGEYLHSFYGVDIVTGWSKHYGLIGKGEYTTNLAYEEIGKRFRFDIKGIDVDIGSEFINNHFYAMIAV